MKRGVALTTASAVALMLPTSALAAQGGTPHEPTPGSCGIGSTAALGAVADQRQPGASEFKFQLETSVPFPPPYCTPPGGDITG
jgi:hypothetical protein